jgi:hypothetical protein
MGPGSAAHRFALRNIRGTTPVIKMPSGKSRAVDGACRLLLSGLKRTCDYQTGGPNSVLTRSRSVGARAKSLIMLRHSPSAILTGL